MRLPVIDGDDAKVDAAATEEMVAYAMAHGVNYYDTAWGYHGGNSETVLGKALSGYPGTATIWRTNSPVMTSPICPRRGRSLRHSYPSAAWSISISICSIMSAR